MIKSLSAISTVLVLAGCANPPLVAVMQNPSTGEIAQCKVDNAVEEDTAREEANACAAAYEKGGWKRLSE